jgi:hypothetical protein
MTLRRTVLTLSLLLATAGGAVAGELAYPCEDISERAKLSGFGISVYQGDDGWFFRSNELGHPYPMSDRSELFLQRLDAVLKLHGVRLVLMPLPSKSMLAPSHAVVAAAAENIIYDPAYSRAGFETRLAALRDLGLPVVDVLAETDKASDDIAYFFSQDLHWRPALSRAAANASATAIEAALPGEFPGTKTFKTQLKPGEPEVHKTVSRQFLNQLCKSTIPAETVDHYETIEADQSVDAFLGDETGAPPINVIGTSFTDETKVYNFSGFLREALQSDVASYSIAGGNIDQSLYKWSHNGLADSGARVLLWEIPYLERLEPSAVTLERTVVPAIAGSCVGTENVVFSTDYSLDDKGSFSVKLPADVKVTGNGYYLVADLTDATPRGFTITYGYRDGKQEIFPVVREARVGAIDHIFAELSSAMAGELDSISIRAMQAGQNSGSVTLCRYPSVLPGTAGNGGTGGADS